MISDYCKQSIPFLGWTVFSQWNGFKKRNSQFFFWHALIINEVSEVVLFQSQFQLFFSINVRIDGWINPFIMMSSAQYLPNLQVRFWHSNLTNHDSLYYIIYRWLDCESHGVNCIIARHTQDVDVLAILDFQRPCFCCETPALYPINLLNNHKGRGRKLERPRRL